MTQATAIAGAADAAGREAHLLQIAQLSASYGSVRVLHGIDMHVAPGEIVSILGANGAGKTSLLRAISNIMVSRTGSIRLLGEDVTALRADALVRRRVAHVPDGRGTFSHLTVEENLRLGAYVRKDSAAADLERVLHYFPRLRERYQQQAGTLSGGEQQMLAIGRALMLRPRLLLLDEPSFGLAPLIVADIFRILAQINQEQSTSMLLVEQNASLALGVSARAYLLETGRFVLSGQAQELRNNDLIRAAYLGG